MTPAPATEPRPACSSASRHESGRLREQFSRNPYPAQGGGGPACSALDELPLEGSTLRAYPANPLSLKGFRAAAQSQQPFQVKIKLPDMHTPKRNPSQPRLLRLLSAAGVSAVCLASPAVAQDDPASGDDVYVMNPFAVTAEDEGQYVASNSLSGTRSRTPIREVPLNIQVFTEEFAQDLLLVNNVDFTRYNAALANGGDDLNSDIVIQQQYNEFFFRGFRQNWGLRDGTRNYDPLDAQGLSRIEIVKGPVAAMYGVTYPGGVINAITKNVVWGSNFLEVAATYGDHNSYRGTVDAQSTAETEYGKIGVRYNGAYQKSSDFREHSEGRTRFNQVNVVWAPSDMTSVRLLVEDAYRELPNGLGYFTTGEIVLDDDGNPVLGPDGLPQSIGNRAEIPLQIVHPEIGWDWNWHIKGNDRDIATRYYRGEITHSFNENLSVTAYALYSTRDQADSQGWDAAGGGGSAASWDMGYSGSRGGNATGWVNPFTDDEAIVMHFHRRDWNNRIRGQGGNVLYKMDIGEVHNTFTAGAHWWKERFWSTKWTQPERSPYLVSFPVVGYTGLDTPNNVDFAAIADDPATADVDESRPAVAGMGTNFFPFAPPDYFVDIEGNNQRERNENEYYFVSWQAAMLDNRLRTTAAVNYTRLELSQWLGTLSYDSPPGNYTEQDETSPLLGVMFDVTKEISVYGVYATSLFPVTDKDSFDRQMPPVKGTSIEIGAKVSMFDEMINGTVSLFKITQEGGALNDPAAVSLDAQRFSQMTPEQQAINFPGQTYESLLGDLVPGAEAESTGIEADLYIQPTKNFQIILSAAHTEVETTEAVGTVPEGRIPTEPGQPENQLSAVTKYTFDTGPMDGMFVGLGLQWNDGEFQGYAGDVARYDPEIFYLEAFAGYHFELNGIDSFIQLNVKNLTEQPGYVGWKATGSADVLATERYEVPTDIRWSITYRARF